MSARNLAFDLGFFRVTRLPVPVIAVGNLTAGGTGKTPLVEWIVRRLLERGRIVGIVSRGYGRRSSGVVIVSDGARVLADPGQGGDEPVQMAWKFPAARVVVGERRVEAAEVAVKSLNADVLVLDDVFQHRYLHRDLNILVDPADVSARANLAIALLAQNRPEEARFVFAEIDLRHVYDGDLLEHWAQTSRALKEAKPR